MALDVTILKVKHHGEKEARKLLSYIKACNVFAPESAYLTEQEANEEERELAEMIAAESSRTSYKKYVERKYVRDDEEQWKFDSTLYDYLFRSKKRVYYLERFTQEEAQALEVIETEAEYERLYALGYLLVGKINEFYACGLKYLKLEDRIGDIRDQHIGKNLSMAETEIRKKYRQFEGQEPLKLAGFFGYFHKPERYASIPVREINVQPDTLIDAYDRLDTAMLEGKTGEELHPFLLEAGLSSLVKKKRIQGITLFDLERMTHEERVKFVRNLSKTPERNII